MARSNLAAYAFEWGTISSMIFKLCMDHQGLEVYSANINDDWPILQQGQVWSNLLIVLIPDSIVRQVSVYRTIGLLVFTPMEYIAPVLWLYTCTCIRIFEYLPDSK